METYTLKSSNSNRNDYSATVEFPNGWTASIICHSGSYGGKNNGARFEVWAWRTDNPSIHTDNPVGWLNFHGVAAELDKISRL